MDPGMKLLTEIGAGAAGLCTFILGMYKLPFVKKEDCNLRHRVIEDSVKEDRKDTDEVKSETKKITETLNTTLRVHAVKLGVIEERTGTMKKDMDDMKLIQDKILNGVKALNGNAEL